MEEHSELPLEPSVFQIEQAQLPQPSFIGEVFQPSEYLNGFPLDPLQELCVLPVLRATGLDGVLSMERHTS